jgi:hypothetical protein
MQPTPRRLTIHQKAVLIHVLIAFPDQEVGVCYDPGVNDALDYAQDFLMIFNVIGWKSNENAPSGTAKGQPTGLTLVVPTQRSLPPAAAAFRDALLIYGIEAATIYDSTCGMKPGGFILSVGPQTSE